MLSASAYAHTPHHAIDALQVSPDYSNDGTVFVLTQNTLHRSTDRGASWKQLVNGLYSPHIFSSIAISPWFSTDNSLFVATDGGGVFASTDNGNSFGTFNAGLAQQNVGMLQIVGTEGQLFVLAAGSTRGLFVSPAAKENWRRAISDDVQITALHYVPGDDGGYVIAGDAQGGVWRSNAELDDWRRMFRLEKSGGVASLAAIPADSAPDTILIGTRLRGLLRTADGGSSFENLSGSWPNRLIDCADQEIDDAVPDLHVRDIDLLRDESGHTTINVTTWYQGVMKSMDGGLSWVSANNGLRCDQQADEDGFNVPQFRALAASNDSDWFLAGFNGLFRSDNKGKSWVMMDTMPVSLIRGLDVALSTAGEHAVAVGTYGGGAYVSMNDGNSWLIANHGLRTTRMADLQFASDGRLYALAKDQLLVADKPGGEWANSSLTYRGWRRRIGAGLERRLGVSPDFGTRLFLDDAELSNPWPMEMDLSPDFQSDKTIFVGLRSYGVWKTESSGVDWIRSWEGPIDYITALQVSPNFASDSTVFASARGSGILVSKDAGNTWRRSNDGFDFMESYVTTERPNYISDPPQARAIKDAMLAVSPDFASDQTLLAGSASGLYRSTDSADSWTRIDVVPNREAVPVRAIAFSPSYQIDQTILVSLKGLGIYRSVDQGHSFEAVGRDVLNDNLELKFIEFSPLYSENRVVFGASDERILMSSNAGTTWAAIERPVRYEDWRGAGEGPIRFSSNWSRESGTQFSAMTQSVSVIAGESAELGFFGNSIVWWGERCPDCGRAEIWIDGNLIDTIDLYNDKMMRAEVFSTMELASQQHQLRISVSSQKNDRSRGHRVAIDALDALAQ